MNPYEPPRETNPPRKLTRKQVAVLYIAWLCATEISMSTWIVIALLYFTGRQVGPWDFFGLVTTVNLFVSVSLHPFVGSIANLLNLDAFSGDDE